MDEHDSQALETLDMAKTVMKKWAVGGESHDQRTHDTRSPTPLPFRAKVSDIVNLLWESASAATQQRPDFAFATSTSIDVEPCSQSFRMADFTQNEPGHDVSQPTNQNNFDRQTMFATPWIERTRESSLR